MDPHVNRLLDALRLQIEWGADEALAEQPIDRFHASLRALSPQAASGPVSPAAPGPVSPAAPGPVSQVVPAARAEASRPGAAQTASELAAQAATPAALRAALEQFDGCDLRVSATHLVFADGSPLAGLVFIGEAPGAEEDRSGRPFAGPGGQLLDRMLASIGLDRSHCLLTYVIPWRPPGNRPPSDAEVAVCLPFLQRHLALLKPRRIVTLGALPIRALTGSRQPLGRLRGRWLDVTIAGLEGALPTLPMLHPDQLRERPLSRREAWADLISLRRSIDQKWNDTGAPEGSDRKITDLSC